MLSVQKYFSKSISFFFLSISTNLYLVVFAKAYLYQFYRQVYKGKYIFAWMNGPSSFISFISLTFVSVVVFCFDLKKPLSNSRKDRLLTWVTIDTSWGTACLIGLLTEPHCHILSDGMVYYRTICYVNRTIPRSVYVNGV